tara:strand:+ start:207 stop:554 length:348 start_codon:yes stop_codon:yes gene_type:complete
MPKYYQASFIGHDNKCYQICDTSQTTIEKKAKERVVRENTPVYIEAVEMAPLSLKSFVNTLNLKEKPTSREVVAVFIPKKTDKGFRAKRLNISRQRKRTKNLSFHPNFKYLTQIA